MKYAIHIWIVLLVVLHYDFWFADSTEFVFDFIPAGLFFQMVFTMIAAGTWYFIGKRCWPDRFTDKGGENDS